jgi:hypothetical protein
MADTTPEGEPFEPIKYTSDVFPTERVDPPWSSPRRRRYSARPQSRHRADRTGLKAMWWTVLIIALVVVLVLSF